MSLKPGLGDTYYQEHKEEIWRQGYIQCTNGKQAQIPRYYEKMMEKENPERLWRIKQNRQRKAIEQKRLQLEGYNTIGSVQTLLYTDVQKFLKRLRKAYKSKLRFFCAGEYGEQTARPHYHMILYGWEPKDLKQLYKIHHNGYYTSEWLEKLWGNGQIQIAQAVPETYRYVAGYVTKKMYEIIVS